MLSNRCVLQQQHVDCKIADALLKKGLSNTQMVGTRLGKSGHTWLSIHPMLRAAVVTFNDVTKDAAFYTTTSRFVAWLGAFPQERQKLWLPKDDLRDSSSWSSPPILLLRDIHSNLLTQYDCKKVCASSQSQVNVGASAILSSQDGVSQQQETAPLSLPQLNRLFEGGMRALSPMLMLLSSPHSVGSHNRYSATDRPSGISNLCLRARVALNSQVCAHNST